MFLPKDSAASALALADLRRRINPTKRIGSDPERTFLSTGLAPLDKALGGGLRYGEITEFSGNGSNGRTAVAAMLASRVSNAQGVGEGQPENPFVAWVDAGDNLDVDSLHQAGVNLKRLLWLRGEGKDALKRSLKAAELLIDAQSFSLIILDCIGSAPGRMKQPGSWWIRLSRRLKFVNAAALVLTQEPSVFQPACRVVFHPSALFHKPLSFGVTRRGGGEVSSLSPILLQSPSW